MNKAGIEMFGYASVDEMLGISLADLWVFPHEREKYLEKLKKNRSVTNYEALMKKKDGTEFWIIGNVHYTPIFAPVLTVKQYKNFTAPGAI